MYTDTLKCLHVCSNEHAGEHLCICCGELNPTADCLCCSIVKNKPVFKPIKQDDKTLVSEDFYKYMTEPLGQPMKLLRQGIHSIPNNNLHIVEIPCENNDEDECVIDSLMCVT
jgi:hypothetical protein